MVVILAAVKDLPLGPSSIRSSPFQSVQSINQLLWLARAAVCEGPSATSGRLAAQAVTTCETIERIETDWTDEKQRFG